jgi:ABC-2 type transport system permease protein
VRTWALVVDTWREAFARYTLLGFVVASTLFLLTLTFALNLDIVDGVLAAGSLFGKAFDVSSRPVPVNELVTNSEAAFAGMAYALGLFLAVFTTGSLVPNLSKRGTVDLYLTRPTSRTHVLLARFLGAATVVAANIAYLCGGVFLVVSLKTSVWNFRFLAAGALIFFVFLSYLGLMFLIGALSGSTPLSIMIPYAIYMITMPLAAHQRIEALVDSRLAAGVVRTLYWVLPKSAELGRDMLQLVLGRGTPSLAALATTGAFGLGCLVLGLVCFARKDF